MKEITIKLDEQLIQTYGYAEIQEQIKDFVNRLYLKISAQEILKGIQDIELETDAKWQVARELAWKQESKRYTKLLQE